jgi:hypothetical protein
MAIKAQRPGDVEAGALQDKHSTDVESPPPPPRVCMRGLLRTRTRPTLNVLLYPPRVYVHAPCR